MVNFHERGLFLQPKFSYLLLYVLSLRLGPLLRVKIDRRLPGVKDKFSVSSLVLPPLTRHLVMDTMVAKKIYTLE